MSIQSGVKESQKCKVRSYAKLGVNLFFATLCTEVKHCFSHKAQRSKIHIFAWLHTGSEVTTKIFLPFCNVFFLNGIKENNSSFDSIIVVVGFFCSFS